MDEEKTGPTSQIPIRKKPRKISVIKPSKYEAAGALHANKDYWRKALELSNKEITAKSESQKLSEVLPADLYEKVCNTLDIPLSPVSLPEETKETDEKPRKTVKTPMISHRKTILIERELDSDTDVEISPRSGRKEKDETNIHLELLQRPEREQITWPTRYLQPEREDEKSLVRRADDLTNRIAEEFCEYMKQLGGDQQSQLFTPKAIKELFQVEFDTHASRGLRVIPKELASVSEKIANVTGNPRLSQSNVLEREITKDIEAESRPERVHAFGRSLTAQEQWRAPKNDTKSLWRSSRHVPRDLVTMKTVWEGITDLRSVKEYCRWMIEHPEYTRAPYLCSLGMFDSAVLNARRAFESGRGMTSHAATSEVEPMEDIRRRLSQLADSIE